MTKPFFLTLIFLAFMYNAFSQSFQVSGTVSGRDNTLLPGATVAEAGNAANIVITDSTGKFSISVTTAQAGLLVTAVGYQEKNVAVNNQPVIHVVLEAANSVMSEVVVTAYTTQRRENITGSVATVSSAKLQDVTTPSVSNMLQGKVAGVDIVSNSGRPGAAPTVHIRGRSSIRSSIEPLWVVDGVIQHGTPELAGYDVQNISILKDAAAGALFGSRGANGVILVSTKSGRKNRKGQFNVSAKAGVSQFNNGKFKLYDSRGLYDYWGQFTNPTSLPAYYNESLLKTNTDWVKLGTQNAPTTDINASYSGGTDRMGIYTSGNYYKEEGTVKGYTYERLSGRLNVDYDFNDKITFSPKIFTTYVTTDNRQADIYQLYRNMPWDNPFDSTGKPVNAQKVSNWIGRDVSNYLYNLQWNYSKGNIFTINTNLDLEYRITNTLAFNSTNNISYYNGEAVTYTDPKSIAGLATNGSVYSQMSKRITRFTNQKLTYTNKFDRHSLKLIAAYEFSDYKYNDLYGTGNGIVSGATIPDATSTPADFSGAKNDYAFQSVLLNGTYGFDDRYNLQLSVRRDGSSRFGNEKKYGTFFSASGAWNIHNEKFFQSQKVDYFRLRASYGGVGNVPTSLYGFYELYALNAQYAGIPAAYFSQFENQNLTWEKSYETNIGLELGLFNRLQTTFEVYNKNTSDLLDYVPLPDVTGLSGYWDNIGSVRNRGFEWTIGGDVIKNKNLTWRFDFNIGINRNKITDLYNGSRQIVGNKIYEVGQDIDTWFMRKWAGVDPETGNPLWERVEADGSVTKTNNYSQATLQKVGTSTPNYFGGFSTTVNYKSFYLRTNFAYSQGAVAYHAARELFDSDGAYPTYNQMQLASGWSRWSADNRDATHPRLVYGGNNNAHRPSSRFLEDVGFLRMRNLTLGYDFKSHLIERLRLSRLGIYVSADNLITVTKFSGVDPEVITNATLANSGADASSPYPTPKRIIFGLNVSF